MSRRALAGTGLVVLAAAGCGGSSHSKVTTRSAARRRPPARFALKSAVARTTAGSPAVRPQRAGLCSTAVASQRSLAGVPDEFVATGPEPFGVASATDGRFAFVSVAGRASVLVVGGFPSAPRVVHVFALPSAALPLGAAVTPDDRYLLLANGGGALVLSVARLERGTGNALLGSLRGRSPNPGGGAIEVTTSRDSRYAFVSLEGLDKVAVYNLQAAVASHFHGSQLIGSIPTGVAPVGMTVSPDGQWLYVTSEVAARGRGPSSQGTVTAVSIPEAVRNPARSVVATVSAGCGPVRITTIDDGRVVLVTARESDELLAFAADRLRAGSHHALIADTRVGEAPVGLAPADGGALTVVADSNRFYARGASAALTVVNSAAMLAGKPSIVGQLHAGDFPRDVAAVASSKMVVVTDFDSAHVQIVDVGRLG